MRLLGHKVGTDETWLLELLERLGTGQHVITEAENIQAMPVIRAAVAAKRELDTAGVPVDMLLVVDGQVRAVSSDEFGTKASRWYPIHRPEVGVTR